MSADLFGTGTNVAKGVKSSLIERRYLHLTPSADTGVDLYSTSADCALFFYVGTLGIRCAICVCHDLSSAIYILADFVVGRSECKMPS